MALVGPALRLVEQIDEAFVHCFGRVPLRLFPTTGRVLKILKRRLSFWCINSEESADTAPKMECAVYFRSTTSFDEMDSVLQECNEVLLEDFGPDHELLAEYAPDLLVVCRAQADSKAIGLLTLHHTPETRAWEMGTMSARAPYAHTLVLDEIMRHVPEALLGTMQEDTVAAWIVKRVKQRSRTQINRLARLGFKGPAHFMIGVLSDEGYIPFDPFDEVLLKIRLCPPALARLEASAQEELAGRAVGRGGEEEPLPTATARGTQQRVCGWLAALVV